MDELYDNNIEKLYDDLINYFIKLYYLYKDQESYKLVIMSNHCLIMLKKMMADHSVPDEVKRFFIDNMTTPEEFLNQAGPVSDLYLETNEFCQIVLVDLVCFRGSNINSCLFEFEKRIIDALQEKDLEFDEYDSHIVQRKLASKLRIHYLAKSKNILLLLDRYSLRLNKDIPDINQKHINDLLVTMANLIDHELPNPLTDIDPLIITAVDSVLYEIAYEKETHFLGMCNSGIYISDAILSVPAPKYSLDEFVTLAQNYLSKRGKSLDIDRETMRRILNHRANQGYVDPLDHEDKTSPTEQAFIILPQRYEEYINVLIEIYKVCTNCRLDIDTEIKTFMNSSNNENGITAEDLYDLLMKLQSLDQKIEEWDISITSLNSEKGMQLLQRKVEHLCKYMHGA